MTATVNFSQIDIEQAVTERIQGISDELAELHKAGELQISITAATLFYLEALGYMVDLTSGMVTRDSEQTQQGKYEVVVTQ